MHESKNSKTLVQTVVAITTFFAVGAWPNGAAQAVTLSLTNTNWEISYDPAQVSNISFTAPTAGTGSTGGRGILGYTKTFSSLSPIDIAFRQTSIEFGVGTQQFGLRLTLNESVVNNSASAWDGFDFLLGTTTLIGTFVGTPMDGAGHPNNAHFHNDTASFTPFSAPGFPGTGAPNYINLGGGTLPSGATGSFTGIGLHEWEFVCQVPDRCNDFALRETAHALSPTVAEPASLALLGIALAGLGFSRRKRTN